MATTFEIRQQVHTVMKSWLVTIATGPYERVMRASYDRYVEEHPNDYFEFIRVETHEDCLAFTPKLPGAGDNTVDELGRLRAFARRVAGAFSAVEDSQQTQATIDALRTAATDLIGGPEGRSGPSGQNG